MRTWVAALLVALALSGCFAPKPTPCPTCAVPTDTEADPPQPTTTQKPVDYNDSGYIMIAPWHVGNAWDYFSNESNEHTVRVLQEQRVNNTRMVLVEETDRVGDSSVPRTRARSWVDGDTLARFNTTFVNGTTHIDFQPFDPEARSLRNGSFAFAELDYTSKNLTDNVTVRANSYFTGFADVHLSWGIVNAGHVDHRILRVGNVSGTRRDLVSHWPFRDYGADVQYTLPTGETFTLIAVRYGSVARGTLAPT